MADTYLFVGKGGGDGGEGDNVGEEHGHVFLGLGRDLNGSDRHNKYTQRGKLGLSRTNKSDQAGASARAHIRKIRVAQQISMDFRDT